MTRAILAICVLTLIVVEAPPSANAAPTPTCFGERATIIGTSGDDRLEGTEGPDVIAGLDGIDEILGRGGDDLICGGDNPLAFYPEDDDEPMLERLVAGPGDDRIDGGRGMDSAHGGRGSDVVFGGSGWDQLSGGPGPDRSFGGLGRDYMIEGSRRHSHGSDKDLSVGGPGRDELNDFYGNDRLRGGTGGDRVNGGAGDDLVRGGSGDDVLAGDRGDDRLRGGPGVDLGDFAVIQEHGGFTTTRRSVRVDLGAGSARGHGRDALTGLEGALGGSGSDTLIGNSAPNTFYVGTPVYGKEVHDRVSRRGGRDTISFAEQGGCCYPVHVDLSQGRAAWVDSDSPGSDVRLRSIENIIGSAGSDTLIGNHKRNRISALAGSDVIAGRGGDDLLLGGVGALPDYPQFDEDVLRGGAGHDVLRGGVGSDDLDGGTGRDRNRGGRDHDRCVSPDPDRGARNCEAP